MVGGLLNIISQGKNDFFLIGTPNKTFFKKIFSSHSMFGKQKFRIDVDGSRRLNYNSPTIFNFKIPRYGDLLQEMFFSFTLPNIWSPLISFGGTTALFCSACRTSISTKSPYSDRTPIPNEAWQVFVNDASYSTCSLCECSCSTQYSFWNATVYDGSNSTISEQTPTLGGMKWINRVYPLEFKWIENIGVQAIKSVRLYSNNTVIQEFTGQYLLNMVYRDFSESQKRLFDKMIGHVPELNDPKKYLNRNGNYPNAAYFGSMSDKMAYGLEPSIRSRQLYIPINIWSMFNKTPIPLISMQYSELSIQVEMRPVNEWWVIKNVINEMTIQASQNKLKYNSSVETKRDYDCSGNKGCFKPAEETMNFVEVPNKLTAYYEQAPNPVIEDPPYDISQSLIPPNAGLAIPDTSINRATNSWHNTTQIQAPDDVIAKELQIAAVIPLSYTAPNISKDIYNLRYFLKEPPPKIITDELYDYSGSKIKEVGALPYPLNNNEIVKRYYEDVPEPWFADVHIIANYTFLAEKERYDFAKNCQSYLIKEVHEQTITDLLGGYNHTNIKSQGLVISWMWFFQRSDVKYRNEWSNYGNTAYINTGLFASSISGLTSPYARPKIYGGVNLPNSGKITNIVWQTEYSVKNNKDILIDWGLNFDSSIREEPLQSSIIAWVDRYSRSQGTGIDGVYYYNFCLNTDPKVYQPSGAVNLSKFTNIYWVYRLQEPELKINIKPNSKPPWNIFANIVDPFLAGTEIGPYLLNTISNSITCDPETKTSITSKFNIKENYIWHYNLHIMEERYNILKIENGIASLVFSRTL